MTEKQEKPDNYIYNWVTLYSDSMRFFLTAARFYQERLSREVDKIKSDSLFKELFGEKFVNSLEITKEINRFKKIGDRLQDEIDKSPDAWDFDLSLIHADIRVLKGLGILYLSNLEKRREKLALNNEMSTVAIQAIDSRLTRYKELLSSGVFKEASPWPLMIEDIADNVIIDIDGEITEKVNNLPSTQIPPPKILSTIEIIDQQLRERCLDLFETFDECEQTHRYDTVISEATRVLEDRIRRLVKAENSLSGVDLMTFAFGGDKPKLIVSREPSEQQAAHLMYRGAIGFIRNPFHHRLIDDISRERVTQILGLVDYLIFVAQNALPISDEDS
jgi:hypothetical protein